jgi:hypothetical protein
MERETAMKRFKWALAGLAVAALVTGCDHFWDPLPGGGGGAASGVFYVLNSGKQQLAGFSFASGSTTPTAVTNSPYSLAAAPLSMAISPNGGYLYVGTGGGIFVYSIGSGGVLTLLDNSQAISGDLPTAMAVDGTGAWLVESIGGSGVLSAIPISSSTGLVDSTRQVQTVNLPNTSLTGIADSPANSSSPYVFVAMGAGGTEVIPFTPGNTNPFGTTTTLTNIAALHNTTGGATAVAVDPSNRLLYIGETAAFTTGTQTGGLRVFTITGSKVAEVAGSPYQTGGTGPSAILGTANFVYVANRAVSGSSTGNITGYPIASTGGVYSLGTLINTIAAGTNTVGLAEDSQGSYLLAVNLGGSPDLSAYTFDTTTSGKLDAGPTAATGTDPVQANAIVAVP